MSKTDVTTTPQGSDQSAENTASASEATSSAPRRKAVKPGADESQLSHALSSAKAQWDTAEEEEKKEKKQRADAKKRAERDKELVENREAGFVAAGSTNPDETSAPSEETDQEWAGFASADVSDVDFQAEPEEAAKDNSADNNSAAGKVGGQDATDADQNAAETKEEKSKTGPQAGPVDAEANEANNEAARNANAYPHDFLYYLAQKYEVKPSHFDQLETATNQAIKPILSQCETVKVPSRVSFAEKPLVAAYPAGSGAQVKIYRKQIKTKGMGMEKALAMAAMAKANPNMADGVKLMGSPEAQAMLAAAAEFMGLEIVGKKPDDKLIQTYRQEVVPTWNQMQKNEAPKPSTPEPAPATAETTEDKKDTPAESGKTEATENDGYNTDAEAGGSQDRAPESAPFENDAQENDASKSAPENQTPDQNAEPAAAKETPSAENENPAEDSTQQAPTLSDEDVTKAKDMLRRIQTVNGTDASPESIDALWDNASPQEKANFVANLPRTEKEICELEDANKVAFDDPKLDKDLMKEYLELINQTKLTDKDVKNAWEQQLPAGHKAFFLSPEQVQADIVELNKANDTAWKDLSEPVKKAVTAKAALEKEEVTEEDAQKTWEAMPPGEKRWVLDNPAQLEQQAAMQKIMAEMAKQKEAANKNSAKAQNVETEKPKQNQDAAPENKAETDTSEASNPADEGSAPKPKSLSETFNELSQQTLDYLERSNIDAPTYKHLENFVLSEAGHKTEGPKENIGSVPMCDLANEYVKATQNKSYYGLPKRERSKMKKGARSVLEAMTERGLVEKRSKHSYFVKPQQPQ